DGDAPLTLKVHIIKQLRLRLALGDGVGIFKQTIGKCTLAVVDMRYNTKITNVLHLKRKSSVFG
ncbi:MAG: hypothetical protein JWP37_4684, partial [Mucilaginibacter sp.]|nr:hypothetical protein [Mucilaginibacter sp.]